MKNWRILQANFDSMSPHRLFPMSFYRAFIGCLLLRLPMSKRNEVTNVDNHIETSSTMLMANYNRLSSNPQSVFKQQITVQESCAIAKTTARCAIYIAALKILESPWLRWRPLVSKIVNGLLLGLSLRMFRPNLKFIGLSVPEIIRSIA